MITGLTLGKFAPFHKGHQYLIDVALSEMDRVVVLVYDAPGVTSVPLPVRSGWIRELYPRVEIIEGWGGPTEVGDCPEVRRVQEEYILQVLAGRRISHFYSSEFYGEHVSRALGAVDRRVDPERSRVPASGTAIRRDPYAHRRYLDPVVYQDLITRVVFLGGPSTGKTTIALEMARRCSTRWMPEYGREYWEAHQGERRLSQAQLVEIAEEHLRRERHLLMDCNGLLFVDTDATTTLAWSLYYYGEALPRLIELAAAARRRYDLFFLCEDDIPFEDTWDRSGEASRTLLQRQIRADLLRRRVPFVSLRGALDRRIGTVERVLQGFDRFGSLADHLLAAAGSPAHAE